MNRFTVKSSAVGEGAEEGIIGFDLIWSYAMQAFQIAF